MTPGLNGQPRGATPGRTLVRGGLVLVGDPRLRQLEQVDVLIADGRIVQLAASIEDDTAAIIDADQHWVIPGFVDTHTTLWQSSMRALTGDWLLDDYFWCIRLNHVAVFTPDDVYAATYGGAVSQLDAGVTCTVDFAHCINTPDHADAGVQAIIDARGRAVWCYGFYAAPLDRPVFTSAEARFDDARRVKSAYFPTIGGRVTFGVSPTETFRASYEQIRGEFLVGKELDGLVHPHTNTRWRPGARSDVEVWHEQGILWQHQLHSHCNTSTAHDFALMLEAGCSVSSTPESELAMGIGQTIVARADAAGLNVGLGADIQANDSPDSLMSMRLAMQNDRAFAQLSMADPGHGDAPGRGLGVAAAAEAAEAAGRARMRTEDVLHYATLGGARGLGLGDVCGSIEVGKAADLVLIDTRTPRLRPVTDPVAAIVTQVTVADLATVMVDGTVVKSAGVLDPKMSHKAAGLLDESARRVASAVAARGGWMPPRPAPDAVPRNHAGAAVIGDVSVS